MFTTLIAYCYIQHGIAIFMYITYKEGLLMCVMGQVVLLCTGVTLGNYFLNIKKRDVKSGKCEHNVILECCLDTLQKGCMANIVATLLTNCRGCHSAKP